MRRRTPLGARTQLLTTRNAPPLAPGLGDGGGPRKGVVVGTCTLGGAYRFDPFDAYAEGLVTNPNVLVAGQVGRGKSALVKCLLARAVVAGRRCVVVDPKGEYAAFARALGADPVSLEAGGHVRLNPLAGDRDDPARPALLAALVASSLERRVGPAERAALEVALHGSGRRRAGDTARRPRPPDRAERHGGDVARHDHVGARRREPRRRTRAASPRDR